jgi:multidrug efflux pump subunit AcrA (membrane-fusion protein)
MDVRPLQDQLAQRESESRLAAAEMDAQRRDRTVALAGLSTMLAAAREELHRAKHPPVQLVAAAGRDPGFLLEAHDRLRVLTALNSERRREWDERIAAAASRRDGARKEAERLRKLIRQAKRYSPIQGVITSVRADSGHWVKGGVPVVRVDDPQGYHVVALVRDRTGAVPEPGTELPVRWGKEETKTRVSRVLPGWDRELFSTWVWMSPERPARLEPGLRLEVLLPRTASEVGRAPAPVPVRDGGA